jgi:hypothetical protein
VLLLLPGCCHVLLLARRPVVWMLVCIKVLKLDFLMVCSLHKLCRRGQQQQQQVVCQYLALLLVPMQASTMLRWCSLTLTAT